MKLKKKSKQNVNEEVKVEEPTKKYNDLREVMDMNRPYTMLFSGVEDDNNFQILYDMGIRNFLISYHYVQKKRISTAKYEELGVKFFVDSGAFTYMSSLEHQEWTIEQWEKQIDSYLKWIEKHQNIVFAFASLDLEYLVGGDKVQEWNEKYFEPFMLRTGIPVCFVHHDNASKLSWEQYCQRYPYVGISWGGIDTQGNDLQYGLDRLKVAEKYNTLVHGMAMTHTSLLTKIPFYTTDSTTWLVGLQYGEVNYWTGQKMSRLKKDKWKGSMLSNLVSKGFDEQKLLEEDTEEMIRVNVQAFIEAEQFVQERLKSRMYWLRAESVKRTSIDDVKFPSVEWCDAKVPQDDWKEYAQSFNVSQEDKNVAIACITDITVFTHWEDPDFTEYRDAIYKSELIKELHDQWINRIVTSEEERIEDLQKFYTEVLLGEETKLLYLGTNFDRTVKEREDYIDDTEYEYEDVSDMEINNLLSSYLPNHEDGSAPEIDELDDEIFEGHSIIPVRDENGRFLKGQRQVMKPKKLYSAKYPKLACDTCYNAQKCPEYKAGYACAYHKMFERFDTRDMGDIIQAMQGIVDFNMGRLQRAMLSEMLNGGMIDPAVSQLMNQNMGFLNQLKQMYEYGNQEVIRQTKVMRADGTQETTTQVSNPQRGGILESLFKNMKTEEEEPKEETQEEVVVESKSEE